MESDLFKDPEKWRREMKAWKTGPYIPEDLSEAAPEVRRSINSLLVRVDRLEQEIEALERIARLLIDELKAQVNRESRLMDLIQPRPPDDGEWLRFIDSLY